MTMTGGAAKAVFLSYASQDAEAARRLCDRLRTAGVEVWFDQSELRGGDAWDAKIRKQIRECALFLPVISANTQARLEGYFRLEWKLAAQRTHTMAEAKPFLVPVVIDGTKDSEAHVPPEFGAVQWTPLPEGDAPAAFLAQVQRLLGSEVPIARGAPGVDSRRSREAPGRQLAAPPRRGWSVVMAVASIVLLAAGGWLWSSRSPASQNPAANTSDPAKAGSASPDLNPKSLVVLPLENLSPDPENAFFTDGLHAQIIATLSRVTDLKVIGRESSLALKRGSAPLAELARKVGVANVMTGSVRRAGNKVLILLELRRAKDEELLWAPPATERALNDVGWAVQTEIAEQVGRALQARESVGTNASARYLTKSSQAYDLFIKASAVFFSGLPLSEKDSIPLFTQAVALDENFVMPVFMLSMAHIHVFGQETDPDQRAHDAEAAQRWARLAAQMDPGGVGANVMSAYLRVVEMDHPRSLQETDKSLQTLPNEMSTHTFRALTLSELGRAEEALVSFRQATVLDPLNFYCLGNEPLALANLRRKDESLRLMARALASAGGNPEKENAFKRYFAGARFQLTGELPASDPGMSTRNRAKWLWRGRHFAELEKLTEAEIALAGTGDLDRFDLLLLRHDALVRLGRTAEAETVARSLLELARQLQNVPEFGPSEKSGWLAQALVRAGKVPEGIAAGRSHVEAASPLSQTLERWRREAALAGIYAYLGRPRECVDLLAKLLVAPSGLTVPMLRVDPTWDNVREDPGFRALLADPKNSAPL